MHFGAHTYQFTVRCDSVLGAFCLTVFARSCSCRYVLLRALWCTAGRSLRVHRSAQLGLPGVHWRSGPTVGMPGKFESLLENLRVGDIAGIAESIQKLTEHVLETRLVSKMARRSDVRDGLHCKICPMLLRT